MLGFDTTMKGRFRRACIRCARRIGRRERVKFAEENKASVDNGGRPFLEVLERNLRGRSFHPHLTRSAKLRGCRAWLASPATSSSAIVVELGG